MIYMLRNRATGQYYRHSGEFDKQWSKTPRTFTTLGYLKRSIAPLLVEQHFLRLGNRPSTTYKDWRRQVHNWWSNTETRAMWEEWNKTSHLPLAELLPEEWEIIEMNTDDL